MTRRKSQAHSRGGGSRPRFAAGGRHSPEAPAESVSGGSCEASPGRSGQRPRCPAVQRSAQTQEVALARSKRPHTPAHRQSARTPGVAGHCGYNRGRGDRAWEGLNTPQRPTPFLLGSWACFVGTDWAGLSPDAPLALHAGGAYSPGPVWAPGPTQQHVFPRRARPVHHLGAGDLQAPD